MLGKFLESKSLEATDQKNLSCIYEVRYDMVIVGVHVFETN